MRPLAIGFTLRRLVAKCASIQPMSTLLTPQQLGDGVHLGVVHSARIFLQNMQPGQIILKLDFLNAFNSILRDKMLSTVEELAPFQAIFTKSF